MGEYDESLTLEGKIAVDFAHARIACGGFFDTEAVCKQAKMMMAALKKHKMLVSVSTVSKLQDMQLQLLFRGPDEPGA
jgi:hypothetical protein